MHPQSEAARIGFVVLTFGILALVIAYVPWLSLVVVGYAYASRLRHHRAIMVWLWALAGAATLGFVLFFTVPLLGITLSEVGPVHFVHR